MNCQLGERPVPSLPADQRSSQADTVADKICRENRGFCAYRTRHLACIPGSADMPFHLLRKAIAIVPVLALLWAGRGLAQTGGTIGTGVGGSYGTTSPLTSADFTMYFERNNGDDNWIQMNTTETQYFFNRARCECDTAKSSEVKVAIVPASTTTTKIQQNLTSSLTNPSGDGRLYAGSAGVNCLDVGTNTTAVLPELCTNLLNPAIYGQNFPLTQFSASNRYESPPIPVAWLYGALLNPTCASQGNCDAPGNCSTVAATESIAFWANSLSNDTPDASNITLGASLVGTAPSGPETVTAEGGNEALIVSWTWPAGSNPSTLTTFLGLQLFCQRGENNPVFNADADHMVFHPSYMTAKTLCPDNGVDTSSYGQFGNLDPLYLCSGLISASTTSHRITGLQNGITYGVGVAAIDRYGNISPITDIQYATPVPSVDFYTEYRDDGGQAQGGFCAIARGHGRTHAIVGLGLVGLALLLVTRRPIRRRPGASAVVLLLAGGLAASPARAQTSDDLHDSDEPAAEAESEPPPPPLPSTWTGSDRDFAVELRFGLFLPNVDSEISKSNRQPNQLMFGSTRRPMWQIEFDWEVLQTFGTLSLGASVGYWKENGHACLLADLQASGTCKASNDNTSLRLIPLAALVIYRMDEAAQRWKIPLVPYGKLGLNYTIWTVTNGDGNVPNYPGGGHGQGGTPGWQAAVGLSLQLDFIDPGAAREFDSESGVNHTYAFFELDHVSGSGLYRNNVLHVGDDTWFAGLMFEF